MPRVKLLKPIKKGPSLTLKEMKNLQKRNRYRRKYRL